MALTLTEEKRLKRLELTADQIKQWTKGAASENMLNRLLILCNEEISKMDIKITELEEKVDELIALARKLQ